MVRLTLLVVLFSFDFLRLQLATMGSPELSQGSPALLEHRIGLCLLSEMDAAQGDAAASALVVASWKDRRLGPPISVCAEREQDRSLVAVGVLPVRWKAPTFVGAAVT